MNLAPEQIRVLLTGIDPRVTGVDYNKNTYVPQQHVRATLNRVFGFCGWSLDQVHEPRLVARIDIDGGDKVRVTYLASVRLEIDDVSYTGAGTHTITNRSENEGDAHDGALKGAESQALKRAAMNLGDQFGLGLYNDGNTDPYVRKVWHGDRFVTAADLAEKGSQ